MDRGFPVVRVELEGMRLTLQTAITEHLAKRDEDIKAALDEAIKAFDVKGEVQRQATQEFRSLLAEVVGSAMRKALWDDTKFRAKITEQVANEVAEYIKRGYC